MYQNPSLGVLPYFKSETRQFVLSVGQINFFIITVIKIIIIIMFLIIIMLELHTE